MSDHIVERTKLVCPHCGLPADRNQNGIQGYRCGSSYCETFRPQWARSMTCLELQNGQLQDRIKRLEAFLAEVSRRWECECHYAIQQECDCCRADGLLKEAKS